MLLLHYVISIAVFCSYIPFECMLAHGYMSNVKIKSFYVNYLSQNDFLVVTCPLNNDKTNS